MDMSHEAAKNVAFTISSRHRPLQKTSGTLGPGLVIQQADRMCIFRAWLKAEIKARCGISAAPILFGLASRHFRNSSGNFAMFAVIRRASMPAKEEPIAHGPC